MAGKKEKEKHRRIIIITIKQQKCKSDAIDENTNDTMEENLNTKKIQNASNVDDSKALKCLLSVIIPILPTLVSIVTLWFRYRYATEAESFYGIEKSLFYSVIGSEVVLSLIHNGFLLILLPICLIFLYFFWSKKFSGLFGFCIVLVSAIYPFIVFQTLIEYLKNWNQILTFIFSAILALFVSILGTIAFWFMYLDETQSKINWRKSTIREILNNSNNDNSNQNKRSLSPFYFLFYVVCFIAAIFILISYSFIGVVSLNNELPSNKKTYEIVQKLPFNDMQAGKRTLKASVQVVILHRGTQVLLMNGKIDGKEIINLQEDITPSSNLEIDTSSYEFQEASQYRFYRIKFEKEPTRVTDKR
jgi:membrane protein